MSIPRMRTAEELMREIKLQDPETGITMNYIRSLIRSNKIPVTNVGRKKLVNLDIALKYIGNGVAPEQSGESELGVIRRVPV